MLLGYIQGFSTPSPGLYECFELKREVERDPTFKWPAHPPHFRDALEVKREFHMFIRTRTSLEPDAGSPPMDGAVRLI
eukprot:1185658-Prorocentrum_minimum.AAC.7